MLIDTFLLGLAELVQTRPLTGLLCCALLWLPLWLGWWWFWRLGRQTLATGRYPPVEIRLLRPIVLLTGAPAIRRGRILCGLALVLTLLTGLLTVVFWGLLLDLKSPAG